MSPSVDQAFPFLKFPRELRNKVYQELLCSFNPPPVEVPSTIMEMFQKAGHGVDTAILRTSSQIYREAYDVMVKENRFVLIQSMGGLPIAGLLNKLEIPVIGDDKTYISKFRGFVLAVFFSTDRPIQNVEATSSLLNPCSIMILDGDLHIFCEGLLKGDNLMFGFSVSLRMSIVVGPGLICPPPHYEDSLVDFYTEKTQNSLLNPFREVPRGIKHVQVSDSVSPEIAKAVQEELARDEILDSRAVLAVMTILKERGQCFFRQKQFADACITWLGAASDIERLHRGSSWDGLVRDGGEAFLTQIAEIYFLLRLNITHLELVGMEHPLADCPTFGFMASDSLFWATKSIKKDFWKKGFEWTPSVIHRAKLMCRWAVYIRLIGDMESSGMALIWINKALELCPNDSTILRERESLRAWIASQG